MTLLEATRPLLTVKHSIGLGGCPMLQDSDHCREEGAAALLDAGVRLDGH